MKATLATLVLYVYNKYLYEDWSVYTKWGKRFIYPFWLIRWVYVGVASPFLALGYYWEKSEMHDIFQEARLESMVMMDQMMNQKNK
jgi:hypothetical protein